MRLVRVKTPEGKGAEVAQLALELGISEASVFQMQVYGQNGRREINDAVDISSSTPKAKTFIDAVMSAPFFDPEHYSIMVRQPRAIVSKESPKRVTRPVVIPTSDIYEELWQFSHVTSSFVGRMFIGALLLSYGMMKFNLLLMVAGLMFLPLLPLMLAMGFGLWTREWRLVGQGLFALLVGTALTIGGGAAVAAMTGPPLRFQEFSSMLTAFLISTSVGVAAGLATGDDAGRRELIGLAATAQVALIPAWVGISLVIGFPQMDSSSPAQRMLTFAVNVGAITITSLITYAILRMKGNPLWRFSKNTT